MKSNLSVSWDEEQKSWLITDICSSILSIFGLPPDKEQAIGTTLQLPEFLKYLDLLKTSSIQFIDFLYSISDKKYSIKIIKEDENSFVMLFTLLLDKTEYEMVEGDTAPSDVDFFNHVNAFLTNDNALESTYLLKDATKEKINLEIYYAIKLIQQELNESIVKSIKKNKEQDSRLNYFERNMVKKDNFSFNYLLKKTGWTTIVFTLVIVSLFNQLFIRPFTTQIIDTLKNELIESFN